MLKLEITAQEFAHQPQSLTIRGIAIEKNDHPGRCRDHVETLAIERRVIPQPCDAIECVEIQGVDRTVAIGIDEILDIDLANLLVDGAGNKGAKEKSSVQRDEILPAILVDIDGKKQAHLADITVPDRGEATGAIIEPEPMGIDHVTRGYSLRWNGQREVGTPVTIEIELLEAAPGWTLRDLFDALRNQFRCPVDKDPVAFVPVDLDIVPDPDMVGPVAADDQVLVAVAIDVHRECLCIRACGVRNGHIARLQNGVLLAESRGVSPGNEFIPGLPCPLGFDTERRLGNELPGQAITIRGPRGEFTLEEESLAPSLFVAAAGGYGPVLGMVEQAISIDNADRLHVYLVDEPAWGDAFENRLRAWEDALDNFEVTRLPAGTEVADLRERLREENPDLTQCDIYLAGPDDLVTPLARIIDMDLNETHCRVCVID